MSGIQLAAGTMLMILSGCAAPNSRVVTRLNLDAVPSGDLFTNPLQWPVITSGFDAAHSTMYTLYGNGVAIPHSRMNAVHHYPSGSVLALVTWRQQEDERWFGALIPAKVKAVEFVTVEVVEGRLSHRYQSYSGAPLRETRNVTGEADGRVAYLLSLRAAVMP